MKKCIVIGVDEAGRGPLAGPVSVGAVLACVPKNQIFNPKLRFLKNIKDSKKLSASQRENWLKCLKTNLKYCVCMASAETIDKIGIQRAIKKAICRAIKKFDCEPDMILLDGSLHAPEKYNQKIIIKGDEKIPLISAASIFAKVCRDKKMHKFHKIYPEYCFDKHVGYGTKLHYQMLKKHGLCPIHRRSYLKNLSGK